MKKSYKLSILFLLCVVTGLMAQSSIPQPIKSTTLRTNTSSDPLANYEQQFYYYNTNNLINQIKTDYWDGTNWLPSMAQNYEYDTNGNNTIYTRQELDSLTNTLKDAYKSIVTFSSTGQPISERYEQFNDSTNTWEWDAQLSYTYHSSGQLSSLKVSFIDDNTVGFGFVTTFTFDSSDRIVTEIYASGFGVDLKTKERKNYFYTDADALVDRKETERWNSITNVWDPAASRVQLSYTPTADIEVTEEFIFGNWRPEYRNTWTKNSNGDIEFYTYEVWWTISQIWKPQFTSNKMYNADRSLKQETQNRLETGGVDLYVESITDYEYAPLSSTNHLFLRAKVDVFPNPTANIIQVNVENNGSSVTNFNLINSQGNIVASQQTANTTTQFSISDQPAGTYYLEIEQNNARKVVKVVKQ
jgi:hypothetical protein